MDIEIDGTSKALDESDDSGLGLRFFESTFFAKVTRDGVGHDV